MSAQMLHLVDRYAEPDTEILQVHDPAPRAPGQCCNAYDLGGYDWSKRVAYGRKLPVVTVAVRQPDGTVRRERIPTRELLVVAS